MLSVCNAYKDYCFPMIGLHPTSVNADYEKELDVIFIFCSYQCIYFQRM